MTVVALLRMTVVALVACSSAGAEPGPAAGAEPLPPGWKPLPAIAAAVAAVVPAAGVAIDLVDAWGAPALGCYAVRVALHGGAEGAPALADEVLGGFAASGLNAGATTGPGAGPDQGPNADPSQGPSKRSTAASAPRDGDLHGPAAIAITEVVRPTTADGVLAFAFDRPPYHGRVRAHLAAGRVRAIACFENQREPTACEAACTRVLQGVP
jgi:hypothetical protein